MEKLWDYSQRWEMSTLSVNYQGYLMAYKCVPLTVDLVKAHVTMSVVSLPAGMNECPQDSFLHNTALSGLPGVTKVAFLKSMTGNMCKKFIRYLSSRVSAQPRLQWITTPLPSDTISDQSLCAFNVTTSARKVFVSTLLVIKWVAVQYTQSANILFFAYLISLSTALYPGFSEFTT